MKLIKTYDEEIARVEIYDNNTGRIYLRTDDFEKNELIEFKITGVFK